MKNIPLNIMEQKGNFTLSNGLFCVYGISQRDNVSVDIYKDKTKKNLISMQHNIVVSPGTIVAYEEDPSTLGWCLKSLMESKINEF